jgi:hypothetical protein
VYNPVFPFSDLPLLSIDTTLVSLFIVSIKTRYGPEGPGIEFRWKPEKKPVQTGPGAHLAFFYTIGIRSFPWGKADRAWR